MKFSNLNINILREIRTIVLLHLLTLAFVYFSVLELILTNFLLISMKHEIFKTARCENITLELMGIRDNRLYSLNKLFNITLFTKFQRGALASK